MAELTDLSDLIYEDEPSLFIKTYLECLIQGYSLKFPVEKSNEKFKETWTTIIGKLESEFTDDFVSTVNKKWIRLLKQNKSPVDASSPKKLYKLLTGHDFQDTEAKIKPEESFYNRNMDPLKAPKDSGVSDSYYKQKELDKTAPLTLKDIAKRKKAAFKSKDADLFIIYHLSIARHNEMPKVPLSSLPETILHNWEDIILSEYNKPLPEEFGKNLCSKWYYYVNQKGIPNTIKGIKNILFSLMIDTNNIENTSQQEVKSTKAEKPKGFLKRLFK